MTKNHFEVTSLPMIGFAAFFVSALATVIIFNSKPTEVLSQQSVLTDTRKSVIVPDGPVNKEQHVREEVQGATIYKSSITTSTSTGTESALLSIPTTTALSTYVEVIDGCGAHYEGECLNVRSGPGTTYPVVAQLRNGIVLKSEKVVFRDGRRWHKLIFDEWLRYPERVRDDWYVATDYIREVASEGVSVLTGKETATSTKKIIVDRSDQMLYAYDGDDLFLTQTISTGLELTPTPRGTFAVFRKTPSRYMQGPLPGISGDYYDLPGVPWNLYFTEQGAVIHGAYWHNKFGTPYSHGCVNVSLDEAEELYNWADLGTVVVVRD